MEPHRFDALAKALASHATRRAHLGLLTAVARGSLARPDAAWAASGACKSPCAECEQCKAGKCKKKHGKKRCKPGTCQPQPFGTPCGSGGRICQGVSCACPSGQTDSGGVCGTQPTCQGPGTPCAVQSQCCSNFCNVLMFCNCSKAGDACHDTSDCCQPQIVPAALSCVGFVCTG